MVPVRTGVIHDNDIVSYGTCTGMIYSTTTRLDYDSIDLGIQ